MLVHEHALVKIREDMPMAQAALIGCGVTTGVGSVIHTANVETGATVAVSVVVALACRPSTVPQLRARRGSSR
jgi:Zn-dependent alcohol dehydrogenase